MNWREKLIEIEGSFGHHEQRDWKPVIAFVENLVAEHPNDVEVNIRVIYLIHNILVEEEYSSTEHGMMANLLKQYFQMSCDKFSENSEYLFFIGKILHIAEWYFGLDDNQLALEFQKRAMNKEPGNLLYEWAYRFSCVDDAEEGRLAHQLIENDKDKIVWLNTKGFPGAYILEHLKMSNEKYLQNRIRKN